MTELTLIEIEATTGEISNPKGIRTPAEIGIIITL